MNLRRLLIPNGLTNRSPSRNALSPCAFALDGTLDDRREIIQWSIEYRKLFDCSSQARFSFDGKNRHEVAAASFGTRVFGRFIRGGDAENSESGSGEAGTRFNWTDLSVASAILNAN